MSYILGLDYGTKYIGIAISDKNAIYSKPYLIKRNNEFFIPFFDDLLKEYSIEKIVVGTPLSEDGYDSNFSLEVKNFIKCLNQDKEYILWNETLSSDQAKVYLSKKKKRIDDIAASIILQEYLDYINRL